MSNYIEQPATRLNRVQQGALTTLQSALTQATDCGLFDEMAAHSHPDRINAFCDDLDKFTGAEGLKANQTPQNLTTDDELAEVGERIAEALPEGNDYDKGFRDALESMSLALARVSSVGALRDAIETALDAHCNNVADDDEATAPTARDLYVGGVIFDACKRAVEKGRSLDGLNVDAIASRAVGEYHDAAEVGAQRESLPSPGM